VLTFMFAVEVAGFINTEPVTPALMEPVTANVSAVRTMLALLAVIRNPPSFNVPPTGVVSVTPAGPATFPFSVMFELLTRLTVPELALALKLTAPVLLRLMFPAPVVTAALRVPAVVAKAVPLPIEPAFDVSATVEAVTLPLALFEIDPPTSTVTVLPVASIAALFAKVPVPELAL